MRTLIAYYSRTGITKALSHKVAQELKAEEDEIIDLSRRNGALGFIIGGHDALFKKDTDVEFHTDPEEYDLVILATPVWAGTLTPAVRSYINRFEFSKVAFIVTSAGADYEKTLKDLSSLVHCQVLSGLGVSRKDSRPDVEKKIQDFMKTIKEQYDA